MFANRFSKVYHYHLRRCGGGSLNEWLMRQVDDSRVLDKMSEDAMLKSFVPDGGEMSAAVEAGPFAAWLRALSQCGTVLCTQVPMRELMHEEGVFCATVLRQPLDRLASQVADMRAVKPHDYGILPAHTRVIVEDAKNLNLREFLEKHAHSGYGQRCLDNYLVRAVAAARLGYAAFAVDDAASVLDVAMESLERDFHVVGLRERLQETQTAIAFRLGLAPDSSRPWLNVTRSGTTLQAELQAAAELLAPLVRHDLALYQRAAQLFSERHEAEAAEYHSRVFEDRFAEQAVQKLKPTLLGADLAFSVRMPLIGGGFHGRDAGGTDQCRVWSGPQTRTVLYMPVPAGQKLTVKLWIHGYASIRQRDLLKVMIDGETVEHRFEISELGHLEVIAADVETTRSFLCVAVELHQTLTSDESGESGFDSRQRGFSFDHYGWRIMA
jgi:hypothetical protein